MIGRAAFFSFFSNDVNKPKKKKTQKGSEIEAGGFSSLSKAKTHKEDPIPRQTNNLIKEEDNESDLSEEAD